MKLIRWLSVGTLLSVISSCDKNDTVPVVATGCQLQKVFSADSSVYAQFYYTDWGAPSHILLTNDGTGEWDYVFYHDSQKRLTAFLTGLVRPPDTATWNLDKYVYENGLIVRDTSYNGSDVIRWRRILPYRRIPL